MALKNFMFDGSYSRVTNVGYDKQRKVISFEVSVYDNALEVGGRAGTVIPYFIHAIDPIEIKDRDASVPPSKLSGGDKFIVSSNPSRGFEGHSGKLAEYDAQAQSFSFSEIADGAKFRVGDEANRVFVYSGGTSTRTDVFSSQEWNKYFAPDKLSKSQNNILKAIYTYLKTMKEYSNSAIKKA